MVYTYLIVYKEGLVSGKLAQTNGSAAIPCKQARHRSRRSRGASGQPNPSPFPSLHYYLNLTVSACGKQKGGIIHIISNVYLYLYLRCTGRPVMLRRASFAAYEWE